MPFPRRIEREYDPHRVEEWVKRFWEENSIYSKVKRRKGKSYFNFLDGPPYPSSGIPHAGTAWNKVLKDAVLRYKRMNGFEVNDTPGYDCHGLPIEVAVEKKLGVKVKKEIESRIGVDRFIEECRNFALKNLRELTKWFKELGVFMDWDNPYLTLDNDYIEAAWWLIKKAHENGLLERDYRVVYWCPRCQTTLAEYEVEYQKLEDPSIYVKFRVKDEENTYLLIWTTTPWTLPANTFVMAHPEALYVKVRVGSEYYILARSRLEHVMAEKGVEEYEVVETFPGKRLEGIEYVHPLEDIVPLQKELAKYHRVVMAPEHVTLHEGTGLVHAAPGHGFEDFEIARKIGIEEIVSPITDEGRFTSVAGKYAGKPAREANQEIIRDLEERNALFHRTTIVHRYPVCWRCKTPVLLRATTQWVLRVTRLKDKLRSEAEKTRWLPKWALERLNSMIDNLQDWVLSRQRYWGTPLPIWVCTSCGHTLVVGSREELAKHGGHVPEDLHKPWIDKVVLKCPKCGAPMKRVPDVIDVWFDSGVAFYASKWHPDKHPALVAQRRYKVDFITEGHDQTRGWFFSLLRAGVIGFGETPYNTVLVHGFMLDAEGREMHKSLGNYVAADEILRKAGADVFRFWILQNTIWEDARFSWDKLGSTKADLNIIWNVYVFATTYMELDRFNPLQHRLDELAANLKPEDKWILSRLAYVIREVTEAFEDYRIDDAVRALKEFMIEDVSHWYIRIIRRRVWVEEESMDKLAAYATLYTVLRTWLLLAAPIIPFFTERIYQEMVRASEPGAPESIHMAEWPRPSPWWRDEQLEKEMDIVRQLYEATASLRMKAGLKSRLPIRKVIVFTDNSLVHKAVEELRELVLRVLNTRDIEVKKPGEEEKYIEYRVEPIYSKIGPEFRKHAKDVIRLLDEKGNEIAKSILSQGEYRAAIDDREVRITAEHVKIVPIYRAGFYATSTEWGTVVIDTKLSEEEIGEGFARDIVRRIQFMRKKMDLDIEEQILVYIALPEEYRKYIEKHYDYIANEVRAREIIIVNDAAEVAENSDYTREWEINGATVVIGVKRINSGG